MEWNNCLWGEITFHVILGDNGKVIRVEEERVLRFFDAIYMECSVTDISIETDLILHEEISWK